MTQDPQRYAVPGGEPVGSTPQVSILMVAYNSARHVLASLASIQRHPPSVPYEILLIDNGSDGTGDLVRKQFPQVRIIPSEGNIGFGAGNNRLAAAARGQCFLLLNPDTEVRDDALDRLLAFSRAYPEAGAWGGRTKTPDGVLDAGNFMVFPSLRRMVMAAAGLSNPHPRGSLAPDARAPVAVEVLPGGFMLISRKVWDALGGFDEGFFLYSEEVDLFLRLRQLGFEAWASPGIAIVHDVGSGHLMSPSRIWFRTVAQMHFCHKHWRGPAILLAGVMLWLSALLRLIWASLARPGSARARNMRQVYRPIVTRVNDWWHGYANGRGKVPPPNA